MEPSRVFSRVLLPCDMYLSTPKDQVSEGQQFWQQYKLLKAQSEQTKDMKCSGGWFSTKDTV